MNTRKLLSFFLTLLLLATLLSACGSAPPSDTQDTASPPPTEEIATPAPTSDGGSAFAFTHKGFAIVPGDFIGDVLEAIGEPMKTFEAPSCAFEGIDRIFYYNGFIISTFPKGGEDYILAVTLMDDSVETDEGIYLGMSAAQIEAAYGEGKWNELGNLVSYSSGEVRLAFLLDNGAIVDITYYCIEAQNAVDAAEA